MKNRKNELETKFSREKQLSLAFLVNSLMKNAIMKEILVMNNAELFS